MRSLPHRTRVFLGPSCSVAEASEILPADYQPPARRGDLLCAAAEGFKTIVLIDGLLIYSYPPSPKEVAAVLAQGIQVAGAASLGALRGVELRHLGMRGSGVVYDWYLTGRIDGDDEVVVPFDATSNEALGFPMVRMRYATENLAKAGLLSAELSSRLLSSWQTTYCEWRTWQALSDLAGRLGLGREQHQALVAPDFDVKRLDTLFCLKGVAAECP